MSIRKLRFTTNNETATVEGGDVLGPDHGYDINTDTGEVFLVDPDFNGPHPIDVSFLVPADVLLVQAARPETDLNEVFN